MRIGHDPFAAAGNVEDEPRADPAGDMACIPGSAVIRSLVRHFDPHDAGREGREGRFHLGGGQVRRLGSDVREPRQQEKQADDPGKTHELTSFVRGRPLCNPKNPIAPDPSDPL